MRLQRHGAIPHSNGTLRPGRKLGAAGVGKRKEARDGLSRMRRPASEVVRDSDVASEGGGADVGGLDGMAAIQYCGRARERRVIAFELC